jgi:hypothetical protein
VHDRHLLNRWNKQVAIESLTVRVSFFKHDEAKRICGWEATRGKRMRVPGALMGYGTDLPHDLAQYVVEATTRYEHGFWGLLARGATFKSTGRRQTKQGREVIAAHRAELMHAERMANAHLGSWRAGGRDTVSGALDDALEKWQSLSSWDRLVFEWPTPIGSIERPPPAR